MAYFLLVYDQKNGKLLRLTEFAETDHGAAVAARSQLERLYRVDSNIEVVVLGARDVDTLRQTHGRYFKSVGELLASR